MVAIKSRYAISSIKRMLVRNGRKNILFVGEALINGGIQTFYHRLKASMSDAFNFYYMAVKDVEYANMNHDDTTILIKFDPTIRDFHNMFSYFDFVHVNNFTYTRWKSFDIPREKRNYTITFTYNGSDRAKPFMYFPHFDDISSNRRDLVHKYNYLTWFPTAIYTEDMKGYLMREEVIKEYNLNEDVKILSTIGRIGPNKCQSDIVSLVYDLRDNYKLDNVVAFIVGQYDERNEHSKSEYDKINDLISYFDLSGNVIITGHLDNDKALKILSASDIYIHPSNFEGHSNVVSEAMDIGIPVMAKYNIINYSHLPGHTYIPYSNRYTMCESAYKILTDTYNKGMLSDIIHNAKECMRSMSFDSLKSMYNDYYNGAWNENEFSQNKVAYFISSLSHGGAEMAACDIIENIDLPVDVLYSHINDYSIRDRLRTKGVRTIDVGYNCIENTVNIISMYDIVIFNYMSGGDHEAILKVIMNTPRRPLVILMCHTTMTRQFNGKYVKEYISDHFGSSDRLSDYIMVFDHYKDEWKERYNQDEVYPLKIASRVNINKDIASKFKEEFGSNTILHIGNMRPVKNYSESVEICGLIKKKFNRDDFKLIYVGECSQSIREEILDRAEGYGIKDNIVFYGYAPKESIASIISACSVVLHPSLTESYSLTVAEAALVNKPILVRGQSEYTNYIEHVIECGTKYDAPGHAAYLINNILDNPEGNKGYKWAVKNLPFSNTMEYMSDLITKIVKDE